MSTINIRPISIADNPLIATIIRSCLTEFGANKPGTVYYDKTTDQLFELFQENGAAYFIAEQEGNIVGGGGIFPSPGLPAGTCELVKMYLLPTARGTGIGAILMNKCMSKAKEMGFVSMYIETLPELKKAISVYEKFGFNYLDKPLGDTGHFGCSVWMLKSL
ncbi:MAG: GNAT family N-acetyltransferase [Chitinophagaceae bacterium]|jgi:putative acetyltransferase|nr:GNAT family N-acetyltransferase [Chitinophagaceae bacterium]